MTRHDHTKYDVKSGGHDTDDDHSNHFYSCDHYEENLHDCKGSLHDGKGSWIEDCKDQVWDYGNASFCCASCRNDVGDAS